MISKKRKITDEERAFNDEWFEKYFVVQQNKKAVCLICQSNIACLKEYNIKRHYLIKILIYILIESYLSNRYQYTNVQGHYSNKLKTTTGVP